MAVHGPWLETALNDWLAGKTIKAMLVNDAYVFDVTATVAPADEVSGTGYTAGGIDVTSDVSFVFDGTGAVGLISSSGDISFGTITVSNILGIVFYVDGGNPIACDLFGPMDVDADSLTYVVDEAGLIIGEVG